MKLTHLLTGILLSCISFSVSAQNCVPRLLNDSLDLCVDGTIYDLDYDDSTIYLGGNFRQIAQLTGSFVNLDTAGNQLQPNSWPRVDGWVNDIVSDGNGGWFIGGYFGLAGDSIRRNLAHILPGGQVSAWQADTDDEVISILRNGNTLYVAGYFDSLSGSIRRSVGALHTQTAQLLAWNPNPGSGHVFCLRAADSMLYLAGTFTSLLGSSRYSLAAVSMNTGLLSSWQPLLSAPNGSILSLAAWGGKVYVGGAFTSLAGQTRNRLAAFDRQSGQLTTWNPGINNQSPNLPYRIRAIYPAGNKLYIGGYFTHVGTMARPYLARIDTLTGTADSWNPELDMIYGSGNLHPEVMGFSVLGNRVAVSGAFDTADYEPRKGIAVFDTSGALQPWNPAPNYYVQHAVLHPQGLVMGGGFDGIKAARRHNVAAIGRYDGRIRPWAPKVSYSVLRLRARGNTVYLGGYFNEVNDSARRNLAAVDALSGQLRPWAPEINLMVSMTVGYFPSPVSFEFQGNTVFIGGHFDTLSGNYCLGLAAVDSATGQQLPWDPQCQGYVDHLRIEGNLMYVRGRFSSIGGKNRWQLASLYINTGQATNWQPVLPPANPQLHPNLSYYGNNLYMTARNGWNPHTSSFNRFTADTLGWHMHAANTGGAVEWLETDGRAMYVGGSFQSFNYTGSAGAGMGSLTDTASFPWYPNAQNKSSWGNNYVSGHVSALKLLDNKLWMLGRFTYIHGRLRNGFARLEVPYPVPSVTISASVNDTCYSGPVQFTASAPAVGSLQWTVNGIPTGDTTAVMTYAPQDGDQVICLLQLPPDSCFTMPTTIASNMIEMHLAGASIAIQGPSTAPAGSPVEMKLYPFGISTAFSIRWYLNDTLVSGAGGLSFTFTKNSDTDRVYAVLIPSAGCQDSIVSLLHQVLSVPNASVSSYAAASIRVFPNPFTQELHLSGLETGYRVILYDLYGRQLHLQQSNGRELSLHTARLAAGSYLLCVYDAAGRQLRRELVQKLQ